MSDVDVTYWGCALSVCFVGIYLMNCCTGVYIGNYLTDSKEERSCVYANPHYGLSEIGIERSLHKNILESVLIYLR